MIPQPAGVGLAAFGQVLVPYPDRLADPVRVVLLEVVDAVAISLGLDNRL